MPSTRPFPDKLTARGQLKVGKEYVDFFLQVDYDKYDPAVLTALGNAIGDNWEPFIGGALLLQEDCREVFATCRTGETIRLLRPLMKSSRGTNIEFHCAGFDYGIEEPLELEGTAYLIVRIPFSDALEVPVIGSRSALGDLSTGRSWDDGITFETSLGRFVVADFHHFHEEEKKRILTRVKATELRVEVSICGQFKAANMFDKAEDELRLPLWLLSFASRRFLHWYEMRISFHPKKGSDIRRLEFVRRLRFTRYEDKTIDPLLSFRNLTGSNFQSLLDNLRQSPCQKWILKAIVYCIASYHQPTVETSASSIFMSLEALLTGFAETGIIRQGMLKAKIRQAINALGIETQDLWPRVRDFDDELQEVVKQRNDLIHRAEIEDTIQLEKTNKRLQLIVQRAVLSHLNWDLAKTHPTAFNITQWLQSSS